MISDTKAKHKRKHRLVIENNHLTVAYLISLDDGLIKVDVAWLPYKTQSAK